MQSLSGANERITGKRQEVNETRTSGAARKQAFDRITLSDSSRAQLGDQYHNSYHGPVYQSAAAATPSTGGMTDMRVVDALRFDGMDMRHATIKLAHGNTCRWFSTVLSTKHGATLPC